MKRPTHHDIARLAGTSQATVSLVLNNRSSALRISEQTRQNVLAAARQLGYEPTLSRALTLLAVIELRGVKGQEPPGPGAGGWKPAGKRSLARTSSGLSSASRSQVVPDGSLTRTPSCTALQRVIVTPLAGRSPRS